MKVSELMYPPTWVAPDTSILELAKLMEDHNVGYVLVELGDGKVGIATERDILYKVVAEDKDSIKTQAKDIVTEKLHSIDPDKHVRKACRLFNEHNIRRLLVMDGDKVNGVVSSKDTSRCNIFMYDEYVQLLADKSDEEPTIRLTRRVTEIMREVAKVDPEMSVLDAAKSMRDVLVGEAVTKIDGKHAIVTEIDVLYKVVGKGLSPADIKVKDIASILHTTVDAKGTVRDASGLFNLRNIRRLPVVEGDEIIGIITEKNISKYCVFSYEKTIKALEEIDPESAKSFAEFEDKRMGVFVKGTLKPDK
jgi:signal-transduction protein with cAMP-binding, CBS, and nucleotidyltransferase domain